MQFNKSLHVFYMHISIIFDAKLYIYFAMIFRYHHTSSPLSVVSSKINALAADNFCFLFIYKFLVSLTLYFVHHQSTQSTLSLCLLMKIISFSFSFTLVGALKSQRRFVSREHPYQRAGALS